MLTKAILPRLAVLLPLDWTLTFRRSMAFPKADPRD
jgi:hypothetical protein